MVKLKTLLGRLPRNVEEVAHDSVWTLASEASLIVTVTTSFLMLGRQLGPEGYGEYVGLFAILTPVAAIGSAASLATMQRCFQENKPVSEVVSTFLTVTFVGGLLVTVIASVVARLVLDSLSMTAIVSLAITQLVLGPSISVIAAGVRVQSGVRAAEKVRLLMMYGRFGALVALFGFGALTVDRLGVSWFSTTAAVLIFLITLSMPRANIQIRPKWVTLKDIRLLGGLGAPIYVSDFQTNGDKAVLAGADLDREAGLYGAAFRIVSLGFMPLRAMDRAVFHRFLIRDNDEQGVHLKRARRYAMWSLALVTPVGLVLLIVAPALTVIVGDEFAGSVEMTRWLVLWVPLKALSGPPLNGLLGLGRLGLRLVTLIVSASVSMTLYLILIPRIGWEGAVIGTVVGEVCLGAIAWLTLVWAQQQRNRELVHEPVASSAM